MFSRLWKVNQIEVEAVFIANYSSKNPISVDGTVICKQGVLSDGCCIEVCGTRFNWHFDESILQARTEKTKKTERTPTSSKFGNPRRTTIVRKKQIIERSEPAVGSCGRKSGPKKSQKTPAYTLPKNHKQLLKNMKKRYTMHSFTVDHNSDDDEEMGDEEHDQNESVASDSNIHTTPKTPTNIATPDISKNNTPFYTPDPEKENQTPVAVGKTPQTPILQLENSPMMILSYTPVVGSRSKPNVEKKPLSSAKTATPRLRSGYLAPKNDNILTVTTPSKSQNVSKVGNSMYLIDLTTPTSSHSSYVCNRSDQSYSSSAELIDLTTPPGKKPKTPSSTIGTSSRKGLLRSALKNASKTPISALHSRFGDGTPKHVTRIMLEDSVSKSPKTPARNSKTPVIPVSGPKSKTRSKMETPVHSPASVCSKKPGTPRFVKEDGNGETETPKAMPVMTTDELFDTLVGRQSIKKTYSRKSMSPKKLPSPLVPAEDPSELPKTDIDLWVESVVAAVTSPEPLDAESFMKKPNRTTQVRLSQYSDITPHESFTDALSAVTSEMPAVDEPQEGTSKNEISEVASEGELNFMDDKPSLISGARRTHTPLANKIVRSLGNKRQTIGNFFTNMFGKLAVSPVTRVSITDDNNGKVAEETLQSGLDRSSEHESEGSEEEYHDSESNQRAEVARQSEEINPSPKLRQSLRDTRKFIGNALTSLNTSRVPLDNSVEIDESLLLSETYDDNVVNQSEMMEDNYDLTDLSARPEMAHPADVSCAATLSDYSMPSTSTRKSARKAAPPLTSEISPTVSDAQPVSSRIVRQMLTPVYVSTPTGRKYMRQKLDVAISPLAVPLQDTPVKTSRQSIASYSMTDQEISMCENDESQQSPVTAVSESISVESSPAITASVIMDERQPLLTRRSSRKSIVQKSVSDTAASADDSISHSNNDDEKDEFRRTEEVQETSLVLSETQVSKMHVTSSEIDEVNSSNVSGMQPFDVSDGFYPEDVTESATPLRSRLSKRVSRKSKVNSEAEQLEAVEESVQDEFGPSVDVSSVDHTINTPAAKMTSPIIEEIIQSEEIETENDASIVSNCAVDVEISIVSTSSTTPAAHMDNEQSADVTETTEHPIPSSQSTEEDAKLENTFESPETTSTSLRITVSPSAPLQEEVQMNLSNLEPTSAFQIMSSDKHIARKSFAAAAASSPKASRTTNTMILMSESKLPLRGNRSAQRFSSSSRLRFIDLSSLQMKSPVLPEATDGVNMSPNQTVTENTATEECNAAQSVPETNSSMPLSSSDSPDLALVTTAVGNGKVIEVSNASLPTSDLEAVDTELQKQDADDPQEQSTVSEMASNTPVRRGRSSLWKSQTSTGDKDKLSASMEKPARKPTNGTPLLRKAIFSMCTPTGTSRSSVNKISEKLASTGEKSATLPAVEVVLEQLTQEMTPVRVESKQITAHSSRRSSVGVKESSIAHSDAETDGQSVSAVSDVTESVETSQVPLIQALEQTSMPTKDLQKSASAPSPVIHRQRTRGTTSKIGTPTATPVSVGFEQGAKTPASVRKSLLTTPAGTGSVDKRASIQLEEHIHDSVVEQEDASITKSEISTSPKEPSVVSENVADSSKIESPPEQSTEDKSPVRVLRSRKSTIGAKVATPGPHEIVNVETDAQNEPTVLEVTDIIGTPQTPSILTPEQTPMSTEDMNKSATALLSVQHTPHARGRVSETGTLVATTVKTPESVRKSLRTTPANPSFADNSVKKMVLEQQVSSESKSEAFSPFKEISITSKDAAIASTPKQATETVTPIRIESKDRSPARASRSSRRSTIGGKESTHAHSNAEPDAQNESAIFDVKECVETPQVPLIQALEQTSMSAEDLQTSVTAPSPVIHTPRTRGTTSKIGTPDTPVSVGFDQGASFKTPASVKKSLLTTPAGASSVNKRASIQLVQILDSIVEQEDASITKSEISTPSREASVVNENVSDSSKIESPSEQPTEDKSPVRASRSRKSTIGAKDATPGPHKIVNLETDAQNDPTMLEVAESIGAPQAPSIHTLEQTPMSTEVLNKSATALSSVQHSPRARERASETGILVATTVKTPKYVRKSLRKTPAHPRFADNSTRTMVLEQQVASESNPEAFTPFKEISITSEAATNASKAESTPEQTIETVTPIRIKSKDRSPARASRSSRRSTIGAKESTLAHSNAETDAQNESVVFDVKEIVETPQVPSIQALEQTSMTAEELQTSVPGLSPVIHTPRTRGTTSKIGTPATPVSVGFDQGTSVKTPASATKSLLTTPAGTSSDDKRASIQLAQILDSIVEQEDASITKSEVFTPSREASVVSEHVSDSSKIESPSEQSTEDKSPVRALRSRKSTIGAKDATPGLHKIVNLETDAQNDPTMSEVAETIGAPQAPSIHTLEQTPMSTEDMNKSATALSSHTPRARGRASETGTLVATTVKRPESVRKSLRKTPAHPRFTDKSTRTMVLEQQVASESKSEAFTPFKEISITSEDAANASKAESTPKQTTETVTPIRIESKDRSPARASRSSRRSTIGAKESTLAHSNAETDAQNEPVVFDVIESVETPQVPLIQALEQTSMSAEDLQISVSGLSPVIHTPRTRGTTSKIGTPDTPMSVSFDQEASFKTPASVRKSLLTTPAGASSVNKRASIQLVQILDSMVEQEDASITKPDVFTPSREASVVSENVSDSPKIESPSEQSTEDKSPVRASRSRKLTIGAKDATPGPHKIVNFETDAQNNPTMLEDAESIGAPQAPSIHTPEQTPMSTEDMNISATALSSVQHTPRARGRASETRTLIATTVKTPESVRKSLRTTAANPCSADESIGTMVVGQQDASESESDVFTPIKEKSVTNEDAADASKVGSTPKPSIENVTSKNRSSARRSTISAKESTPAHSNAETDAENESTVFDVKENVETPQVPLIQALEQSFMSTEDLRKSVSAPSPVIHTPRTRGTTSKIGTPATPVSVGFEQGAGVKTPASATKSLLTRGTSSKIGTPATPASVGFEQGASVKTPASVRKSLLTTSAGRSSIQLVQILDSIVEQEDASITKSEVFTPSRKASIESEYVADSSKIESPSEQSTEDKSPVRASRSRKSTIGAKEATSGPHKIVNLETDAQNDPTMLEATESIVAPQGPSIHTPEQTPMSTEDMNKSATALSSVQHTPQLVRSEQSPISIEDFQESSTASSPTSQAIHTARTRGRSSKVGTPVSVGFEGVNASLTVRKSLLTSSAGTRSVENKSQEQMHGSNKAYHVVTVSDTEVFTPVKEKSVADCRKVEATPELAKDVEMSALDTIFKTPRSIRGTRTPLAVVKRTPTMSPTAKTAASGTPVRETRASRKSTNELDAGDHKVSRSSPIAVARDNSTNQTGELSRGQDMNDRRSIRLGTSMKGDSLLDKSNANAEHQNSTTLGSSLSSTMMVGLFKTPVKLTATDANITANVTPFVVEETPFKSIQTSSGDVCPDLLKQLCERVITMEKELETLDDNSAENFASSIDVQQSLDETAANCTDTLEGVQKLMETPAATSTARKILRTSTVSTKLNDTTNLEGIEQLLKTPIATSSIGKKLLRTPVIVSTATTVEDGMPSSAIARRMQRSSTAPSDLDETARDSSCNLEGLQKLMEAPVTLAVLKRKLQRTPAIDVSSSNDTTLNTTLDLECEEQLLTTPATTSKTPIARRTTRGSTMNLDGVHELLKTPVLASTSKKLPNTPTIVSAALNEPECNNIVDMEGIQHLLMTPIAASSQDVSIRLKSAVSAGSRYFRPSDALSEASSVSSFNSSLPNNSSSWEDIRLLKTPVASSATRSGLRTLTSPNLTGIERLATPVAALEQNNDFEGVKRLLGTPVASVFNSATDLERVDRLLKTPSSDDLNLEGVEQMFKTPTTLSAVRKNLRSSINVPKLDRTKHVDSTFEGVDQLFYTPVASTPKVRSLRSAANISVVDSITNLEGLDQLLKTPAPGSPAVKTIETPVSSTDMRKSLKSSTVIKLNDTALDNSSHLEGVHNLLQSPISTSVSKEKQLDATITASVDSNESTLSSTVVLEGVQQLLQTPGAASVAKMVVGTPLDSSISLKSVQQSFRTPIPRSAMKRKGRSSTAAVVSQCILDESDVLGGIQELLRTPEVSTVSKKTLRRAYPVNPANLNETPLNDTVDLEGLQQLLKIPVATEKKLRPTSNVHEDTVNLEGIQQLLKTPITTRGSIKKDHQPDSTVNIEGLQSLLSTSTASSAGKIVAISTPADDELDQESIRSLPANESVNLEGIQQLLKTPVPASINNLLKRALVHRIRETPSNTSANVEGIQHLLETPTNVSSISNQKPTEVSQNDSHLEGIQQLLITPITTRGSIKKDHQPNSTVNLEGVQSLLSTPTASSIGKMVAKSNPADVELDHDSIRFSPANESVSLEGIQQMLETPVPASTNKLLKRALVNRIRGTPSNTSANVEELQQLLETPTNVSSINIQKPTEDSQNDDSNLEGIQQLLTTPAMASAKVDVSASTALAEVSTPTNTRHKRKLYTRHDPDDKTPESVKSTEVRPVTRNEYLNIMDPSVTKSHTSDEKRNRMRKQFAKPCKELTESESESDYNESPVAVQVRKILPSRASRRNIKTLSEEALAGVSPELKYVKPKPPKIVEEPSPITPTEVLSSTNSQSNAEDLSAGRRKVMFNENIQIKEINSPALVGDIITKVTRGRGRNAQKVVRVIVKEPSDQSTIKSARRGHREDPEKEKLKNADEQSGAKLVDVEVTNETAVVKRSRRGTNRVIDAVEVSNEDSNNLPKDVDLSADSGVPEVSKEPTVPDLSDKREEEPVAKRSRRAKVTAPVQDVEQVPHSEAVATSEQAEFVANQESSQLTSTLDIIEEAKPKRSRRAPQKKTKDITPTEPTDDSQNVPEPSAKHSEDEKETKILPGRSKRGSKKTTTKSNRPKSSKKDVPHEDSVSDAQTLEIAEPTTAQKSTATLNAIESEAFGSVAEPSDEKSAPKRTKQATAVKSRLRRAVATKPETSNDGSSSGSTLIPEEKIINTQVEVPPTAPIVEAPVVKQATADSTSQEEPEPVPAKRGRGRNTRKPASKITDEQIVATKEASPMPPPPAMAIDPPDEVQLKLVDKQTSKAAPLRKGRQKPAARAEQQLELHHTIEESLNESHMVRTVLPASHTSTPLIQVVVEPTKPTRGHTRKVVNPTVAALIVQEATPNRRSPRNLRAGSDSRTQDSQNATDPDEQKAKRSRTTVGKMDLIDDSQDHPSTDKSISAAVEQSTEGGTSIDKKPSRARKNPPAKRGQSKKLEAEQPVVEEIAPKRIRMLPVKLRGADYDYVPNSDHTATGKEKLVPESLPSRSRRGAGTNDTNDDSSDTQKKSSKSRKPAAKRPATRKKAARVEGEEADDDALIAKEIHKVEEPPKVENTDNVLATTSRRRQLRSRK